MHKGLLGSIPKRVQMRPTPRSFILAFAACLVLFAALIGVLEAGAHLRGKSSPLRAAHTSKNGDEDFSSRFKGLNSTYARYIQNEKYSIIISTYNRYETFLYLLNHFGQAKMPHLDAIFVIWGLSAVGPPDSLNLTAYAVPVYLQRKTRQSLNVRFIIPPQMRTNAAMHIDDDIHVEGSSVEFMFSVWQSFGREQHRIVGRVPRLLERSQDGQAVYRGGRPKRYDLILTGVSFLDKTMLHWYWENDPRLVEARKYVDEHLNCEDLLMNYVVARKTALSPILADVPGDFRPIRVGSGLSLKPGHADQRTSCLRKFESLFGDILKQSTIAVTPASTVRAFWHNAMDLPKA